MSGWQKFSAGDPVPTLVRTITQVDMIAYAGATWDWHRLHYDHDYVVEHGQPAAVVDGQVFGALLAETVLDWLGPVATLRTLDFRLAGAVYAGETVRCEGEVSAVSADSVATSLRVLVVGPPERVVVGVAHALARRRS